MSRSWIGTGQLPGLAPQPEIRGHQLPASDFTDIGPVTFGTGAGPTTLNSNAEYGTGIPGMPTTAGWDLTTGFGSPRADDFVLDLALQP